MHAHPHHANMVESVITLNKTFYAYAMVFITEIRVPVSVIQ